MPQFNAPESSEMQNAIASRKPPGLNSTHKEHNVDGFVQWYLTQLAEE